MACLGNHCVRLLETPPRLHILDSHLGISCRGDQSRRTPRGIVRAGFLQRSSFRTKKQRQWMYGSQCVWPSFYALGEHEPMGLRVFAFAFRLISGMILYPWFLGSLSVFRWHLFWRVPFWGWFEGTPHENLAVFGGFPDFKTHP